MTAQSGSYEHRSFGVVYRGRWRGLTVAIKELKFTDLTKEVLEDFKKEVAILGKLRHPNGTTWNNGWLII